MSISDEANGADAWQSWTLAKWNEELFWHVFGQRGAGGLHPVVRIPITPEFLAAAARADSVDADLVRERFIEHFRVSRSEFNQLFRAPDQSILSTTEIPPFFAKLVLTLLVASACSETADEGNFRKRLAIEIEHLPGTQYNLGGLPAMWEILQEWLRRNLHLMLRELNLPDPGLRDTIIGYSKGLTFPVFKDYQSLIRILSENDLDVEDSPLEIIAAVRSSQSRFTRAFLHAVDEFVLAYSEGLPDTRSHPFWSAVRSIAWERGAIAHRSSGLSAYGLHLSLADPHAPIFSLIVNSVDAPELEGGFRRSELSPPLGKFCFIIESERKSFQFQPQVLQLLPDFSRSPLAAALRDGCICFADDEAGERVFQATCPDEPQIFLALNENRANQVLSWVARSGVELVHRDLIEGTNWRLIGPLTSRTLMALGQEILSTNPILALIPRLAEPSVRLHCSCRVGDSYLLRLGVYPEVSCTEADKIEAFSSSRTGPLKVRLDPFTVPGSDTKRFRFSRDAFELFSPPVEIEFVASAGDVPIARRTIHACSLVAATSFKEITDSSAWIVEGNRGHLEESDSTLPLPNHLRRENPEIRRRAWGVIFPTSKHEMSANVPETQDRPHFLVGLTEVIAARSMGRQGLTESELVSLIAAYLPPDARRLTWDVLRSLVENWQLDTATARRWGNRKYFAVRPFLIHEAESGNVWLVGLMPTLKRVEIKNRCRAFGVDFEFDIDRATSLGPMKLKGMESNAASRLAQDLGIACRTLGELLLDTTQPIRDIADWSERDNRADDEECEQSFWNWDRGYFGEWPVTSDVQLRRRSWRDRPDEYRIDIRTADVSWSTLSRTWALVMAHALAHRPQFLMTDSGDIVRAESTQGYLPIKMARLLNLRGGSRSGLREREGNRVQYVYSAGSQLTAVDVCRPLLETSEPDRLSKALSRWRGHWGSSKRAHGSTRPTKGGQLAQTSR